MAILGFVDCIVISFSFWNRALTGMGYKLPSGPNLGNALVQETVL